MTRPPVSVVIPVFNAFDALEDCLDSVARHTPAAVPVLVVDDASTDARIAPLLAGWCSRRSTARIVTRPANGGFVQAANDGMASVDGDVVLLNSDTVVTPGWLERLGAALDHAPDVATATPWSNNGEIVSIPDFCRAGPVPPDPAAVAEVIARSGPATYPELPTAVGFCMAIARRALDAIGAFDADRFGRGYGEENDFSRRAVDAGLRNVLCDDAYVAHRGGQSFGPLGLRPDETSMQRVLARHPDYLDVVRAFIDADPLSRRRGQLVGALRRAGVALG